MPINRTHFASALCPGNQLSIFVGPPKTGKMRGLSASPPMRRAGNVRIGEVYDRRRRTLFHYDMERFDAIVSGGAGRAFVEENDPRPVGDRHQTTSA